MLLILFCMRSVASEDNTDTGHAFVRNTYEGGNGGVFFIREAMSGAVKNSTYAWISSDISRIIRERPSMKSEKLFFVNGY